MREALAKIAEIAAAASDRTNGADFGDAQDRQKENGSKRGGARAPADIGCTIKALPTRLVIAAGRTAARINPVNETVLAPMAEASGDNTPTPMMAAIVMSKYWGRDPRVLTVSFMESTPADLRARIVSHMNAWNKTACISFAETQGTGDVRISRSGGGYWSYLGTDILHVPRNRQTMNLQDFTMQTSESEFKRVVRHETGHTLGMPHEHMRKELVALLDPEKTYAYFLRTQGWNRATVDQQVLTPLDDRTIFGTRSGVPIRGGIDINDTDFAFAGQYYPKPAGHDVLAGQAAHDYEWAPSEDVEVRV
jgi:hypothetical protein